MIVVKHPSSEEKDFLVLLELTKKYCLTEVAKSSVDIIPFNGDSFESLVLEQMKNASLGSKFEGTIEQTGPHDFPDIVANKYFGIEVKMTKDNKWISTGNSILESTRVDEVERIYMFFGKFGGQLEIKFRPYQDCLYDIGVTHSPRYKINMDLHTGASIFDKMKISYEQLKDKENPIKFIKEYYRLQLKDGEELWWIDTDAEDKTVDPIIKPFRNLNKETQEKFIAECFILFPQILGSANSKKYERAAAYLVTEYNAVNASLRDSFSAGEKENLIVNGESTGKISSVYKRLMNNAKMIKKQLNDIDTNKLLSYWDIKDSIIDKELTWKKLIDNNQSYNHPSIKPSDIYTWGLK